MSDNAKGRCVDCSHWERLSDTSYTGKCEERKMITPRDYECDKFASRAFMDMFGDIMGGMPFGGKNG